MNNFVDIKIEGINASINIVSVTGHESISDEFSFTLLLSTPINEPLKPEDCLKQPLTIFYNEANSTYKKFGIITSLQLVFSSDPHNLQFRLECQSSLADLKSIIRSNIYTDKTPIEAISEILNKYNHINYFISCTNTLPKKSFIHQYKESDYNFIGRLCEHWGIHYYFDNDEENTLIFADDSNYQASEKIFHFIENPNASQIEHAITTLNMQQTPAISHIIVEGRNPEQDSMVITTEFGKPDNDHSSLKFNGIGIDNEDEALLIAQRRYELQQCQNTIYTGSSTAQDIRVGFTIKIDMGNNQAPLELLITAIDYTACNLNLISNEDAVEFSLTFSAIPTNIVFRPALLKPIPSAISSTARIFSSFENASIAHRDNLGRYKVIFDYMDNQQASHWIRKSQTAGQDNHLDIPLLPNTEVQIAYLGGNPDLPYISCALENSQSTIIPSNNERPYTTCLHTSGKLSLEAGRSFNLSIVAPMDKQSTVNPATPSNIVTKFSSTATVDEYNRLNNNGIKFPNDERLSGDNIEYNVDALQGQTYKVQDTVSFVLGDNPTYFFGQQYREVHAKSPSQKSVQPSDKFSFDLNHILEMDENNIVNSSPTIDKQIGMVRKLFGNRYNYHDGNIVSVRKGDNNEPHKTFNYGARYVEHIINDSDNPTNSLTDGFPPNWQPKEIDYIIRNHHKQFKINHNDTITIQKGDSYVEREGNTERVQTGGSSKVTITGSTRSKDINISGESIKEITASKIKSTLNASTISKTVNGEKKSTTTGSDTSTVNGNKHSVIFGNKTSVVMGGKAATELGSSNKFIGGLKTEMVAGLTIKCALLPEIDASPLKFSKKAYNFKDGDAMIEKAKAKIVKTTLVTITCGAVLMLG